MTYEIRRKMAPRTLVDIFSAEAFRYETFITNIDEVFSHPVDTVKNFLHSKSDNDLTALRNEIFLELCSHFSEEDLQAAGVSLHVTDQVTNNLRKRYKSSTKIDDHYYIQYITRRKFYS